MILADILQWFLIVVGGLLTLNAHWLGAHALFPGLVARARDQIEHRPVRATVVGLLVAAPVLLGVTVLAKNVPHPLVQTFSVGLALLLAFLVLAAQFESFVDPLIVLITVPTALAGGLWALLTPALGALYALFDNDGALWGRAADQTGRLPQFRVTLGRSPKGSR